MKKTAVTAAVSSLLSAAFVFTMTNAFGGAIDAHPVYNCDVNGDGVVNVIDLNVVKNALIGEMSSTPQTTAAVTETPKVTTPSTTTPSSTTNPTPAAEDDLSVSYPNPWVEPYNEIINFYYDTLSKQDGYVEAGFGASWYGERVGHDPKTAFETTGYTFKDLNADGVPELIMGEITDKDKMTGTELGVVYSYDVLNGNLVPVLESWARNQNFLISSDTIGHIGSSGAANTVIEKFQLEKGSCDHKVVSYVFSEPEGDKVVFYTNTTGEPDKSKSTVIENFDLDAEHEELLASKQNIEFIPLKSFRKTNPVTASYFTESLKDYKAYNLFSESKNNTVLTASDDITYLTVYNAQLGENKWTVKPICTCKELKKGQSLAAGISYPGDMPNTAISFIDKYGIKHIYMLAQSGKDGSLQLSNPVYPVEERTNTGAPEVDRSDIAGVWYKDGDTSSSYINITANGKFTAYYADGNVEATGNIVKDSEYYHLIKDNNESLISLKFGDSKNENVLYAKSSGEISYVKVLGPDGAASDGRSIEEILAGSWECGKNGLIITDNGEGIFHARVEYRDEVGGIFAWDYPLVFEDGVLKCDKQGKKTLTIPFMSDEPEVDTLYTDGSATFELDGDKLIWKDDKEDAGKDMKFTKIYDADVLNNGK